MPRPSPMSQLFPHQQRAVSALSEWVDSDDPTGILCLPTGAGKTRTAAAFVLEKMLSRGPVLWLAHRTELIDQAVRTFEQLAASAPRPFTIGRWHRERTLGRVDVLVGSIATLTFKYKHGGRALARLLEAHPHFSLVVVDECHHGVAETWTWLIQQLRERCPKARILGLSATPTRHAEQEQPLLWQLFKEVVHEEPILELIDSGVLARPTIIPIDTAVSFDPTKSERMTLEHGGDIPPSLLERIASSEARNAAVVETYLQSPSTWGQTLIFATTINQARWITGKLRQKGVQAVEAYGSTSSGERADAIEAFRQKRIRVLVNVGLFTEGTDLPGIETLFLARPTRSRVLFQQMVGRGMRGPRIGGGDAVNVVCFHEGIIGLLQDRLATLFASEREALLALGYPGERLPHHAPVAPKTEDPALTRLTELARALLAQSQGAHAGPSSPLNGFWEVRAAKEVAYLPVFGRVMSVSVWVNYLQYTCRDKGKPASIPEDLQLPATVVTPFVQLVLRPGSRVRWIDLARAGREEMIAATNELTRVQNAVAAPRPVAPASVTPSPTQSTPSIAAPVAQTTAPPISATSRVLAKLRMTPRHEWQAIVRKELVVEVGISPRSELDAFMDLLDAALKVN